MDQHDKNLHPNRLTDFPFDVTKPRTGKPVPEGIGAWLRNLRIGRGFTQSQLAEHLCVAVRTVQRWESKGDQIHTRDLFLVLRAFGLEPVIAFRDLNTQQIVATRVMDIPSGLYVEPLEHEEALPAVVDLIEDDDAEI